MLLNPLSYVLGEVLERNNELHVLIGMFLVGFSTDMAEKVLVTLLTGADIAQPFLVLGAYHVSSLGHF